MSKSTRIKKSITMILTLLLLVSSVPSYGASLRFKDVPKSHWSYEFVEEMAEKGYLNGYPNGTFGPNGNLTFMEAISTLSRFSNPTATEKSDARSGYAYLFSELKIDQDWQKDGLAIALFKDIISEKEIRDAKNNNMLNKPITREKTSVFLAKAMELDELEEIKIFITLPHNVLDFIDRDSIAIDNVKYIKILVDKGILDPNGKGNKDFQPKANLTRAEMSKLLSEGVKYLQKNPKEPEVVEYEYITDVIKRITKDAGTRLVIENKLDPDNEKGYIIEDITSITIDGKKSNEGSLSVGQEVKLKIEKGNINIISIEAFSAEETISGVAKYVYTTNNKITLEYKDGDKILTKDYYVDSNTRIYLNDKLSSVKDLKDGDFVELKVKNDIITEIEAVSKIKKIKGIIKDIVSIKEGRDTNYLITIEDKDGVSHKFVTDYKTDIYRKDRRVEGQELKLKDEAYIDGQYDLEQDNFIAKIIEADVVKREIEGRVIGVNMRFNTNTVVTIENRESKNEESYDLSWDAEIIIDGKGASALPSDYLYYAEMKLENDEIVEIYVDTKKAEDSITGRIVYIDYGQKAVYLEGNNINYNPLEDNGEVVIYVTDKTSILYRNGTKVTIDDFRINDDIMAGGIYKGRNFEATMIIIK